MKLPDLDIVFVGAALGLEQHLVPRHGYPLLTISSRPFPRRVFSPSSFISGSVLLYGFIQALHHLQQIRPQVVLGTGGYASVCALLAGKFVGAKLVLFEANSIPGRTNKTLAKIADFIATGFPEAINFFPYRKTHWTGTPIREEIRTMERAEARRRLGLDEEALNLLVFGGSQGARHINETVWDALPRLFTALQSLHIVHLCGSRWEEEARHLQAALTREWQQRYQPFGYREDMAVLIHAADLAVSRAGSGSIAELLVAGVPSILVPYPYAVYDHQRFNALSVVRSGAAKMMLDAELSGERLAGAMIELLSDAERLMRMRAAAKRIAKPFAAEEIVERTLTLLK